MILTKIDFFLFRLKLSFFYFRKLVYNRDALNIVTVINIIQKNFQTSFLNLKSSPFENFDDFSKILTNINISKKIVLSIFENLHESRDFCKF